ncbi:MAG: hypothetical protein NTV31_02420 [Bacteroidia bacterium]|nr:hypothetical protein [Bacteroidia bacterium]
MKKIFNAVELCTLFSTLATLLLVSFTYLQISRYANSMKADFAHKIKIDFFNDEERLLMFLLNNELLEFKFYSNNDSSIFYPYFKLNKEKAKHFQNDSISLLSNVKDSYTTLEIEDILLNHFEDLNMYRINKIIGDDYLYNGFSSYVELVFENNEIQKMLNWLNTQSGSNDSYTGFRDLFKFLHLYESKKYQID